MRAFHGVSRGETRNGRFALVSCHHCFRRGNDLLYCPRDTYWRFAGTLLPADGAAAACHHLPAAAACTSPRPAAIPYMPASISIPAGCHVLFTAAISGSLRSYRLQGRAWYNAVCAAPRALLPLLRGRNAGALLLWDSGGKVPWLWCSWCDRRLRNW